MDAVEDIKQRLALEDVVAQYVQLKRAGRNFKGLSPFTNEHTASFMVSPEKQIWHDFSSGKGGDMFTLVMEMEGVGFKGALELLARQAGIDLDQYRLAKDGGRGREKERLYELLDMAAKFYQVHLGKNAEALDYVLKKRQFAKEAALQWRLGYSPEAGTALFDFAKSKGFSDDELKKAGLSAQRYRGLSDMFRGRIMIPLADAQGRIIGFTARLLKDDPEAPKYINTPQTVLYDKSRHVFGLHLAKEAIRKNKYAVMAEGNMDVIASHQTGVRQVVATAGTALTEYQLKALRPFGPDVRLCFDADRAGLNATERAIPIASKVGINLSVLTLPSGKDPDELIRTQAGVWQKVIEKPQYALDWLIERYSKELDISGAQGKRQFADIILGVVRNLADVVEQEHYLGRISELIGVSKDALQSKLRAPIQTPRLKTRKAAAPIDKNDADMIKIQNHLLALALCRPALREALESIKPQMLVGEEPQKLLEILQQQPDLEVKNFKLHIPHLSPNQFSPRGAEGAVQRSTVSEHRRGKTDLGQEASKDPALPELGGLVRDVWQQISGYVKMLVLVFEELYQGIEDSELKFEAARLQTNLIGRYVKTQKQRIARELENADETRSQALLEAVKKLDSLLKRH